jgi:hypothetical protein
MQVDPRRARPVGDKRLNSLPTTGPSAQTWFSIPIDMGTNSAVASTIEFVVSQRFDLPPSGAKSRAAHYS